MAADPGLTGLTEVGVATADFTPHLALYRDRLGFQVVAQGAIPSDLAAQLWQAQANLQYEVLRLAAPGGTSGTIRLVRTSGAPLPSLGRPHVLDRGVFDFDIYTWKPTEVYMELSSAGYQWSAPPQIWTAPSLGGLDV